MQMPLAQSNPPLQFSPTGLSDWQVPLMSLQYSPNLHIGPVCRLQRLPTSQKRRLEQPSAPFQPSNVKHPVAWEALNGTMKEHANANAKSARIQDARAKRMNCDQSCTTQVE
jgi:hypothetical protein